MTPSTTATSDDTAVAPGTVLMVVDVQDNHFPHCLDQQASLATMVRVIEAAKILEVPLVLTEHYPRAFGSTVAPLQEVLPEGLEPLSKISFSCLGDDGIRARVVHELGAKRIVLIGAETHICITQTALSALDLDLDVTVVADAVTGRKELDHGVALDRLRARGVDVVTWEMLVYEWMGRGGTETFKKILPLVKS